MTEAALVAMRVDQVRREADRGQGPLRRHVVVLREVGGERSLPIWVGPAEAIQIAFALQEEEMPRPLTATFMRDLLRAGGVALTEVRITRLDDNVFYGQAAIHGATGEGTVDARPSDAINLALAADAPIRVKSTVLDASQRLPSPPFDPETYPDTAAEIVTEINQQFARDREQLARDLR